MRLLLNNNRLYIFVILLVPVLLFITGCATSSNLSNIPADSEISMERTTYSFDQDKTPYNLFPEYRILPGDVLDVLFQVQTWLKKNEFYLSVDHIIEVKFVHTPELNERQTIRPDGTITLPYLGEVYVIEKTVSQLTQELKDAYSKIVSDPELYVIVPEFRSAIKELKKDLHTAPRGLSRLVRVRPDGHVTFPMIGEYFVANKTINEVNKDLNKKYEEIMSGLHVDLFLEKHSGSMVYVAGEVKEPGAYSITRPVNILEALTLAGSFTSTASLDSIIIVRKAGNKLIATRVNLEETFNFKEGNAFFYLLPDDIVYVPKTRISEAAQVANDLADVVFFRGWGLGFSWELHNESD